MKKLFTRLTAVILASIITLMFAACSSGSSENQDASAGSETETSETELKDVTLLLDYTPNTNHTGLYVASDLGYYADEGLNVEFVETSSDTPLSLISQGKGDFGISYQEDLTYGLAQDDPTPVKAIATIIQHNTSGFVSLKEKNINSPADFEGKTYGGWGAPSESAVIESLMEKDGADFGKINIVTLSDDSFEILKNDIDLEWIFWGWAGIQGTMQGYDLNYIELRDLDERLDYYTPIIIAGNDMIENDPDLVQRFMDATKKGYEYAIENPDESAEILHDHADAYDIEFLKASQEYLSEKYSEDSDTWGLMKDEVWDNYTDFMNEYSLIDKDIQASDCYTNEFIK